MNTNQNYGNNGNGNNGNGGMNNGGNASAFDFNTAEKQTSFDLIPHGSIVPVYMTIKAGGNGADGWLKASKTSESLMLECEFTVTEGEFAKRKIWQFMVVEGSEKAANISRKTLRAMIESSKGINPDDMSPEAINGRKLSGWGDLNGLAFPIKVGIEKAQVGSTYGDKNKILLVITPDLPEWSKVAPPINGNAGGGYQPVGGYAGYQPSAGYQPQPQMQVSQNINQGLNQGTTSMNQGTTGTAAPTATPSVVPNWLRKPATNQTTA